MKGPPNTTVTITLISSDAHPRPPESRSLLQHAPVDCCYGLASAVSGRLGEGKHSQLLCELVCTVHVLNVPEFDQGQMALLPPVETVSQSKQVRER